METNLEDIATFQSPFWCVNGHVHTIGRSLAARPRRPECKRIEISTPDNDFLEIDVIEKGDNRPVVALFHGLEGSSNRYYIIELMNRFSAQNFNVVAVNFRSCGSRMNRRRHFYHSGETDDMATVFLWIRENFPNSAMAAVGFSLGGNALLKSLAENGNFHPLQVAIAVSVPYDLKEGSKLIHCGFNKVYERLFLKTLKEKLNKKRKLFPELPHFYGSSLYAFDDQITGPIHGFKGADDYYKRCSSKYFVQEIKKPTLLIHSDEDPICPANCMLINQIKQNSHLDYIITPEGGHVGFWSRPANWLNTVIVNYIHEKID